MQAEFLNYDHAKIAGRFGLETDEEYMNFSFLGLPARVSLKTGLVECFDPELQKFTEAGFDEAMTVYDLMCWSKEYACHSDELVNMSSLSNLMGAASAPSPNGFFNKTAKSLDNKDAELKAAIEKIGGKVLPKGSPFAMGDVSAQFDVFCGLKLVFRFWNSDEEFDAQIQLLWDKNVLQYMHYETAWYACGALMARLRKALGIESAEKKR